jgi:hypothetical protein
MTGKWRGLHNEELNNDVYSSPNVGYSGDQLQWNEMGGAYSTCGGGEMHKGFWWGNLRERDQLEDLGIDLRIILKGILKLDKGMN